MVKSSSFKNDVNPRVKLPRRHLSLYYWSTSIVFGAFAVAAGVAFFGTDNVAWNSNKTIMATATSATQSLWMVLYWSLAQWMPRILYDDRHRMMINTAVWNFWETNDDYVTTTSHHPSHHDALSSSSSLEEIPIVYIQDHAVDDLLPYIENKYGKDWKRRPLLLKGLWKLDELMMTSNSYNNSTSTHRRLSLLGLLQENLTIPYFTDARTVGAITPDGMGTIQDIVRNMTHDNAPHKIATQLLLQTYPELIHEVAPLSILTKLFDHYDYPFGTSSSSSSYYFTPNAIRGSNSLRQLFPKLTTVPLFVANSHPLPSNITTTSSSTNSTHNSHNDTQPLLSAPHTALHCEPIGNIAVQLSGEKLWTLIRPEYSKLLRPYIAPDGRAFFVSSLPITQITRNGANDPKRIPYYQAVTEAGDALWVPTWTWHRVDYVASTFSPNDHNHRPTETNVPQDRYEQSASIAIGASIFHFRPLDFVQNNPLFALLIVPAIVLELIGSKTQ